MSETTLCFPSIIELIDYEAILPSAAKHIVNRSQLTIIGKLTQEEIDLAVSKYNAVILDNTSPKNQLR
jgi:hypothetical protein